MYKFIRSEMQQRHTAFTRGSAYLERYCLLIAFQGFLQQQDAHPGLHFSQWIDSRPELKQVMGAIHSNPAAALAPVPLVTWPSTVFVAGQGQITADEQQQVGGGLIPRTGITFIIHACVVRAAH